MSPFKLFILEEVSDEAGQQICDLLHGDDNLSAFFEDPYLDEVVECAFEEEVCATFH